MLKPGTLLVCFADLRVKSCILQNVAKPYLCWHHAELENYLTGCQGRLAEVVHWLTAAELRPSALLFWLSVDQLDSGASLPYQLGHLYKTFKSCLCMNEQ